MILVPLLNPKFANTLAARLCELRVRGTRRFVPHALVRPLDYAQRGAAHETEIKPARHETCSVRDPSSLSRTAFAACGYSHASPAGLTRGSIISAKKDGLHRNSGLPELRNIVCRKSGKPDLRCQARA